MCSSAVTRTWNRPRSCFVTESGDECATEQGKHLAVTIKLGIAQVMTHVEIAEKRSYRVPDA